MACKSKVPRRSADDSKAKPSTIPVHTFSPTKRIVKLVTSGGNKITNLKEAVANELGLLPGSHSIFGLYLGGKLMSSCRLLLDDDVLSANAVGDVSNKYCFQRVALDQQKEVSVMDNDPIAMQLLYWEVKEFQTRNMIKPTPTKKQDQDMKALLKGVDNNLQKQREFLDYVRSELKVFYWDFYHRVDNCTLQSRVTAEEPRAKENSKVSVALSFKRLIITYIDSDGKQFNFCFNWDKIRSVDMDRGKYYTIFEVLLEDVPGERFKNILRAINIQCDRYEYIYSFSKYILTIYEKIANFETELYEEQEENERKKALELDQVMSRIKREELAKAMERIKLEEQKRGELQPNEEESSEASGVTVTSDDPTEGSSTTLIGDDLAEGSSVTTSVTSLLSDVLPQATGDPASGGDDLVESSSVTNLLSDVLPQATGDPTSGEASGMASHSAEIEENILDEARSDESTSSDSEASSSAKCVAQKSVSSDSEASSSAKSGARPKKEVSVWQRMTVWEREHYRTLYQEQNKDLV